jgi:CHASE3 domain sensor protein
VDEGTLNMIRVRKKRMRVFASGTPLRRRVAYSLAIVRLILVPVILLAVYYLFAMWSIVDRIVGVDAAVAMQAEHASIEMLDARRSERNYLLLQDPTALESNRESIDDLDRTIRQCQRLLPEESRTTGKILSQVNLYRDGMNKVADRMSQGEAPAIERIQSVVRAYESQLNGLLNRSRRLTRAQLVQQLHETTTTFDAGVSAAGEEDPVVKKLTQQLQTSSGSILTLSSSLEQQSWRRVEQDRHEARQLLHRAEWIGGIVSALVVLISVWVSFILPREVVGPLLDLKAAVDHAAAGNYEIEFDLQGKGEVVQLANSVRNLIAHVREKAGQP